MSDSQYRLSNALAEVEKNASPDDLRSQSVPPAAIERLRSAAIAALRSEPGFKDVLERIRAAGAKQIAVWTVTAQAFRVAGVFGDMQLDDETRDDRVSLGSMKSNVATFFQDGNGVHEVRVVLEEHAAESNVWADPVLAIGQFLLELVEDGESWNRLLLAAGVSPDV